MGSGGLRKLFIHALAPSALPDDRCDGTDTTRPIGRSGAAQAWQLEDGALGSTAGWRWPRHATRRPGAAGRGSDRPRTGPFSRRFGVFPEYLTPQASAKPR